MKRLILILSLCLIAAAGFAQTTIVYRDSPTLAWTAVTADEAGHDLLPGDIVTYDAYLYDTALGDIRAQPIESLLSLGTVSVPEITIAIPYRATWAAAVRTRIVVAAGGTYLSALAYSLDAIPVTATGPFVYAPSTWIAPRPRGLRDAGM